MKLILPYPPSANSLYRTIVRGRRAFPIKSAEHRRFFADVERQARGIQPMGGPLVVTLWLFRPQRRGDIDGPVKALLDSLNRLAWEDDSQIEELHIFRGDDKEDPRVEVEVNAKGGTHGLAGRG